MLAFLARDADTNVLTYADTNVCRPNKNDAILGFVNYWTERTGSRPGELVFDSRLTIYRNLDQLNAMKNNFISLRRRHPELKERIQALPKDESHRITLSNKSRKYRHPRILDELTR